MDSSAHITTLEGRYAALRASAAELSSDELLDEIEEAQREKDAASARQAVALAHLAAREPHLREDGTWGETHRGLGHVRLDAPELAAPRMGVSVHVATRRIESAIDQATRTPSVIDAMAEGDLDGYRADIVTEETSFLSDESAVEVVAQVSHLWRGLTAGPLRRLLARTAAKVDPEAVAAQALQERERRGLIRRTGVNGTDHWRGDFLTEQARGAWAAVTERARQRVHAGLADTLQVARADAMMELILEHSNVRVVLHATHAASSPGEVTSTGASGGSRLIEVGGLGAPGTTFVPGSWLDHLGATGGAHDDRAGGTLTCDDETGALLAGDVPLGLGTGQPKTTGQPRTTQGTSIRAKAPPPGGQTARTNQTSTDESPTYRIPAAMARLVRLRDGSCRFPGCSTPVRSCNLDHVRAWPTGPTAAHNLMALCRRHHRIKQRTGWRVRLDPDGQVTWRDPSGRLSASARSPHRLRGHRSTDPWPVGDRRRTAPPSRLREPTVAVRRPPPRCASTTTSASTHSVLSTSDCRHGVVHTAYGVVHGVSQR